MMRWMLGLLVAAGFVAGFDRSTAVAGRASASPAAFRSDSDSVAVLIAAGDVATCGEGSPATAELLDGLPGQIVVLGDAAYHSRRDPDLYRTCYDSTWGRHKARTRTTMGNHDAELRRYYFQYFGDAAGPRPGGYYSFDLGAWHVIALNSVIDMSPRSQQGRWLATDLASNRAKCTVAFMHHPRFSSGPHNRQWTTRGVFRVLDSAGVDVVLAAHDHVYERFAPMNDEGKLDDAGIRQFTVGTGGGGLYSFVEVAPNSEARTDRHFGVLKLTLRPDSYSWAFVAVQAGFADTGSTACR